MNPLSAARLVAIALLAASGAFAGPMAEAPAPQSQAMPIAGPVTPLSVASALQAQLQVLTPLINSPEKLVQSLDARISAASPAEALAARFLLNTLESNEALPLVESFVSRSNIPESARVNASLSALAVPYRYNPRRQSLLQSLSRLPSRIDGREPFIDADSLSQTMDALFDNSGSHPGSAASGAVAADGTAPKNMPGSWALQPSARPENEVLVRFKKTETVSFGERGKKQFPVTEHTVADVLKRHGLRLVSVDPDGAYRAAVTGNRQAAVGVKAVHRTADDAARELDGEGSVLLAVPGRPSVPAELQMLVKFRDSESVSFGESGRRQFPVTEDTVTAVLKRHHLRLLAVEDGGYYRAAVDGNRPAGIAVRGMNLTADDAARKLRDDASVLNVILAVPAPADAPIDLQLFVSFKRTEFVKYGVSGTREFPVTQDTVNDVLKRYGLRLLAVEGTRYRVVITGNRPASLGVAAKIRTAAGVAAELSKESSVLAAVPPGI
jgi:hypothetical protein